MENRKRAKIQDELIHTIEILINNAINKNIPKSRDVVAVILDIKDDKYKVSIDGSEHWLSDGIGLNLTVGMSVWIRIVNNNGMYIASRK